MKEPRDPLILEVAAAVGAGRITIACLDDDDYHLDGLTHVDGSIEINPSASVVLTLLHECIHRLRPKWTERSVSRKAALLMSELSAKDVQTLHDLMLVSSKRKRKPRKVRKGSWE